MTYEPKPGEKLPVEDFKSIVMQTPLVSIDLIVRHGDGRVWLGRRVNQPAKGTFFVPGGRITKNETRTAAFERITLAELGVQIRSSEATFLGAFDHIYKENWFEDGAFGTHYVVLAYELAWRQSADPAATKQHAESCWKTEREILDSGQVHENTKAYFRGGGTRSESRR